MKKKQYGNGLHQILIRKSVASGANWRTKMKRKPDILVVLAALLGVGMILSSFSGTSVAQTPNAHIQVAATK